MQVSVENTSALERRLKIQVPFTDIQTAITERMSEVSQTAHIAGFRAGKVPKKVLEQRYGAQVKQEAVSKMIEQMLPVALKEQHLMPASRPVVEEISQENDRDLEFTVFFEVFPVIELHDFSSIELEKYAVQVTDQDVDNAIEKLRQQFANWTVVERASKTEDRVLVDYTSTVNGKPYEHNTGKDIAVEIGSAMFIPGFEEGLVGVKAGDLCTLDLQFPSEWRAEHLAGKPVQFEVTVKSVSEKHIAEIDEAFAKKVGSTETDRDSIARKIRENIEKQVEEAIERQLKEQVTNSILSLHAIPIPKALIEREVSNMHEELHQRMRDKPQADCHHPGLYEQAEKRVALGLILNEIIKLKNLIPDEERVKSRIASLAKMFGNAEFIESMYYESEELVSGVRHTILLDQAIDWVVDQAKVVEKQSSVDELFKL